MREENKLITTNELAGKLGVSPMTIFRLREKGMPIVKVGGSIRFEESKVMEWVKSKGEDRD